MAKRTLSLSNLFLPQKERPKSGSLPRYVSNSVWLTQSCEAWSSAGKDEYVDEQLQRRISPKLRRRKDQQNAVSKVIDRLNNMPLHRTENMQNKISALIDLVRPLANKEQCAELHRIEYPDVLRLEAAIERNDLVVMLEVPVNCWTRNLLRKTQFSALWGLIEAWALLEETDTCLRVSSSPLYRLWSSLIPAPPDKTLPTEEYFEKCQQLWCDLPNCTLLHHIQHRLPVKDTRGLPMVMYMTFMFGWFSKHNEPKVLQSYLRRNRVVLCAQWRREELEYVY